MVPKCWRAVSTMCQAEPSRSPWQWAMERMARMHCRFFAVSMTGPCCALAARDAVGSAVPTATTWARNIVKKTGIWFGTVVRIRIRIQLGRWIRIRIQEGYHVLKCWMFSCEGWRLLLWNGRQKFREKKQAFGLAQRFGSGYGFNQVDGSGSGSKRAKITHKNIKKLRNVFEVLDVLFWGLKSSPVALRQKCHEKLAFASIPIMWSMNFSMQLSVRIINPMVTIDAAEFLIDKLKNTKTNTEILIQWSH